MTDKIYIICEQDVYMDNGEEWFCTTQNLLQGFDAVDKAKKVLEKWAKERNAIKIHCAPKPGYPGYVVEYDNVSTYRWIDVVGIAN